MPSREVDTHLWSVPVKFRLCNHWWHILIATTTWFEQVIKTISVNLLSVFKGTNNLAYNRIRTRLVGVTHVMYIAVPVQQGAIIIDVDTSSTVCQGDSVCSPDSSVRERRQKDKEERLSLVVWRRPVTTLHYFLLETLIKLKEWTFK